MKPTKRDHKLPRGVKTSASALSLGKIDKSELAIAEPPPSGPHHLRFAQPRTIGLKVTDEFTVPICRGHHRQLHQVGNETAWWEDLRINALEIARSLWEQSRAGT